VSSHHNHIAYTLLVDMVEGRLRPDAAMLAHLADCPACAGNTAWLERVLGLMRSDTSVDAPPELVARAKRLFQIQPPAARPSLRQRIAAVLSFDSAATPLAFGMRGGMAGERQLLFNAGQLDVDLRIAPSAASLPGGQAGWALSGQILGVDGGRRIELRGPAGTATAPINALGEFALPPVPAGEYTLTLQLAEIDLDLPVLAVGSPSGIG
jgi:anti-sigma factor RsiW